MRFEELGTGEWARLDPSDAAPKWVPTNVLVQVERRVDPRRRCVVIFSETGHALIRVAEVTTDELTPVPPPDWA